MFSSPRRDADALLARCRRDVIVLHRSGAAELRFNYEGRRPHSALPFPIPTWIVHMMGRGPRMTERPPRIGHGRAGGGDERPLRLRDAHPNLAIRPGPPRGV